MEDMKMPMLSLVVVATDTCDVFFKDCLESINAQNYSNWELFVIDDTNVECGYKRITEEFFPDDMRVHYRKLKNHKGKAYAANIGFHFAQGDYVMLINGHDRLAEHCLFSVAERIIEEMNCDVIYYDTDEISGTDLVNPSFKQDFNKELLLHSHYIGDSFCMARPIYAKLGGFRESLSSAFVYDFLLRCAESRMRFTHISSLLYHRRVTFELPPQQPAENINMPNGAEGYTTEVVELPGFFEALGMRIREIFTAAPKNETHPLVTDENYREYLASVKAYIQRNKIDAKVEKVNNAAYWKIEYNGDDASLHERDYILLKEKNVKPRTKDAVNRMYGILKQPDVAVVGARFLKGGLTVENCGYIFGKDGLCFPAFYNTRAYERGYENLAVMCRDISMVDFSFCMLDKKIYRKLGGVDSTLVGYDLMLDYCLRAINAGYRVVIDPSVIVRKSVSEPQSSEASFARLMEKDGEMIKRGDPFYPNAFNVGLENHRF